jgi:hypothetical protein
VPRGLNTLLKSTIDIKEGKPSKDDGDQERLFTTDGSATKGSY